MRISDWSSDVCSSDLRQLAAALEPCRGLPGVVDVRVKGAIGVVQLDRVPDLPALRHRFVERGVWIRPFEDVVYIMPPFVIGDDDLARLTDAMVDVVSGWSRENG